MIMKNTLTGDCRKKRLCLLLICTLFYAGALLLGGMGIYDDSYQYMDMHIHREPGYCLFLWVLRQIFQEGGLWAAVILQNLLAVFTTTVVVAFFDEEFQLSVRETGLLLFLHLIPHIVTPLFSVERVMLANGIMSEALCYPLFQLFFLYLDRMVRNKRKRDIAIAALLAFLLAITRGQFMAAFLLWLVVLCVQALMEKEYRKILLFLVLTVGMFLTRSYAIKSYNYVFNDGYFIENTYGGVNTLTNLLYASDREDGEKITTADNREIFYRMYDCMVEQKWDRGQAGEGLIHQVIFLEEQHDNIKFLAIESSLQSYLKEQGISGYIDQNLEADRISLELIRVLLPDNFALWVSNYILLALRGLMRCIGIVHPVIGIGVWFFFGLAVVGWIREWKQNRFSREGWLMFIGILSILAISFSAAMTIMCLSRYMIYGFVGFYSALFFILRKWGKERFGK